MNLYFDYKKILGFQIEKISKCMSTYIDAMVILFVLLKLSLRNGCNEGYGGKSETKFI